MKKNIIFKSLFVFSFLIIFAACSEDGGGDGLGGDEF